MTWKISTDQIQNAWIQVIIDFNMGNIWKTVPDSSVQHRQEIGGDICLTTLGKKRDI